MFPIRHFKNKIFENSKLIGKNLPVFDNYLPLGDIKIVKIADNLDSKHDAEFNMNKMVTALTVNNKYIKIYSFFNFESENSPIKNINYLNLDNTTNVLKEIDTLINAPTLFLIGKNNEILTSFSFNGKESNDERMYIKNFLLNIIDRNFNR